LAFIVAHGSDSDEERLVQESVLEPMVTES